MPSLTVPICLLSQTTCKSNTTKQWNWKNFRKAFHKMRLYVDDLLVYLQSPQEKYNIINNSSCTIIKWNKSAALSVTDGALESAAKDFALPLHSWNIKYLRINISPSLSDLSDLNYTPLLKYDLKKEVDLNRWTKLKYSHSLGKSRQLIWKPSLKLIISHPLLLWALQRRL